MPDFSPDLRGLSVLVAEDTVLLADLITEELQEKGCHVIGPVARVDQGVALAEPEALDGALLDVNLAGERCFPIADALAARRIPFAFLTGYGEEALPPLHRGVPRLAKPFYLRDMVSLIGRWSKHPG